MRARQPVPKARRPVHDGRTPEQNEMWAKCEWHRRGSSGQPEMKGQNRADELQCTRVANKNEKQNDNRGKEHDGLFTTGAPKPVGFVKSTLIGKQQ